MTVDPNTAAAENAFVSALVAKSDDFKVRRAEEIAAVYGTYMYNMADQQLQVLRLTTTALVGLHKPELLAGAVFNGTPLPLEPDEVSNALEAFLSDHLEKSAAVEGIAKKYRTRMDELVRCRTLDAIAELRW